MKIFYDSFDFKNGMLKLTIAQTYAAYLILSFNHL